MTPRVKGSLPLTAACEEAWPDQWPCCCRRLIATAATTGLTTLAAATAEVAATIMNGRILQLAGLPRCRHEVLQQVSTSAGRHLTCRQVDSTELDTDSIMCDSCTMTLGIYHQAAAAGPGIAGSRTCMALRIVTALQQSWPERSATDLQLPQRERVQAVHVHDHVAGAGVQLRGAAHQQPHRRPKRLLPQRPDAPRQPVLGRAAAKVQSEEGGSAAR